MVNFEELEKLDVLFMLNVDGKYEVDNFAQLVDLVQRLFEGTGESFRLCMHFSGRANDKLFPEVLLTHMVDNGWILRNQIVIPKPFSEEYQVSHDTLYFFVKKEDYYFKLQFDPYTKPLNRWGGTKLRPKENGESLWDKDTGHKTYRERDMRPDPRGRRKRTVWFDSEPIGVISENVLKVCREAIVGEGDTFDVIDFSESSNEGKEI